jgi:hypothetical protein
MLQQDSRGDFTMIVRGKDGIFRDTPITKPFEAIEYNLDNSSRGHTWRTTEQGTPKIIARCSNPSCSACKKFA